MSNLKEISELVKFEHTIFALPFGISAFLLLAHGFDLWKFILIIIAMVLVRTDAMTMNRLSDIDLDKLNPRTKNWPHAKGTVSEFELKLIIFITSYLFLIVSLMLNKLAFLLSPIVLLSIYIYPKAKRFTYMPHIFLGLVYFLIPIGVDVALNSHISEEAIMLGLAMGFWVSGFDMLYALQDYEFDLEHGVKSIAVWLGKDKAIYTARLFHVITFLCLLWLHFIDSRLGALYLIGLVGIAGFLVYEHKLIKPNDLSKLNKAFFTVNGYISIVFMLLIMLSLWIS